MNSISNDVGSWVSGIENTFDRVSSYIGRVLSGITERSDGAKNLLNEKTIEANMLGSGDRDIGIGDALFAVATINNTLESTWDHSRLRKIGSSAIFGGSSDKGVNVVINSPKALNPFEVRRQLEQTSRNMANGFY